MSPGSSDASRLPSLLSQLQGAGAGIALLDGSQSEVLAAQERCRCWAMAETLAICDEARQPLARLPFRRAVPWAYAEVSAA